MANIGNALLNMMGRGDPRQALLQQLLGGGATPPGQPPGGDGVPAGVGGGPASAVAGPGPQAPVAGATPQPEVAQAYQSPPDLMALYTQLSDRQSQENNINSGIGLLASAFAQPENKAAMINSMQSGQDIDPFEMVMKINEQKQGLAAKAEMMQNLPAIAEKYGIALEEAKVLLATDGLDDFMLERSKVTEPKTTDDITEYNLYRAQTEAVGGTPIDFTDWVDQRKKAGAATTTITNNNGTGSGVGINKLTEFGDQALMDQKGSAGGALQTISSITNARNVLSQPGGIIAGSVFSPFEYEGRKAISDLFGIDDAAVQNSAQYNAAMGDVVLGKVKQLGTGNSISNADREFTEKAVGASNQIPSEAMPRILNILELGSRNEIIKYNEAVEARIKTLPHDENGNLTPEGMAAAAALQPIQVPPVSDAWMSMVDADDAKLLAEKGTDPQMLQMFDEKYGLGASRAVLEKLRG